MLLLLHICLATQCTINCTCDLSVLEPCSPFSTRHSLLLLLLLLLLQGH
jgi:hypothetical protein